MAEIKWRFKEWKDCPYKWKESPYNHTDKEWAEDDPNMDVYKKEPFHAYLLEDENGDTFTTVDGELVWTPFAEFPQTGSLPLLIGMPTRSDSEKSHRIKVTFLHKRNNETIYLDNKLNPEYCAFYTFKNPSAVTPSRFGLYYPKDCVLDKNGSCIVRAEDLYNAVRQTKEYQANLAKRKSMGLDTKDNFEIYMSETWATVVDNGATSRNDIDAYIFSIYGKTPLLAVQGFDHGVFFDNGYMKDTTVDRVIENQIRWMPSMFEKLPSRLFDPDMKEVLETVVTYYKKDVENSIKRACTEDEIDKAMEVVDIVSQKFEREKSKRERVTQRDIDNALSKVNSIFEQCLQPTETEKTEEVIARRDMPTEKANDGIKPV